MENSLYDRIHRDRLIVILRKMPWQMAASFVEAAYRGGARMFEVTLNSPDALEDICRLRERYDGRAWIGAGTVLDLHSLQEARAAGAEFFLAPDANQELLEYCRKEDLRFLPGVLTPSEVALCLRYGFQLLKLFPAGQMSDHYEKDLWGPFPEAEFVAVGGVRLENAADFIQRGYIGVGIGSRLTAAVPAGDWAAAEAMVAKLVQSLTGAERTIL